MIYEPMLARTFENDTFNLPTMMQPKLDGIRCITSWDSENHCVVAQSRNGKPLVLPDHIEKHMRSFFMKGWDRLVLDGELYVHGLSFQEVMARVKRVKNGRHPDVATVRYCIYDMINSYTFADRHRHLIELAFRGDIGAHDSVLIVPTTDATTPEEARLLHQANVADGYEGSMLRDPQSRYEQGKRSKGLLKWKDWKEEDFEITAILEGKGKNEGTAVIEMKAANGEKFTATAPGDYDRKAYFWAFRDTFIGKKMSVKYQNLTDDGIPRFPEALGVKEDR